MKKTSIHICLFVVMMAVLSGCAEGVQGYYKTDQVSGYGDWSSHIEGEREQIGSGLYIFPDSVLDSQNARYTYACQTDQWGKNEYGIVLDAAYDDDTFQNEVQRLQSITCDVKLFNGAVITNQIQYDRKRYGLPAYVAIYGSNNCFEYALVDEQNRRILYIYLQAYDDAFVSECGIPDEVFHRQDIQMVDWENTNIYYARDPDGSHVFFDED